MLKWWYPNSPFSSFTFSSDLGICHCYFLFNLLALTDSVEGNIDTLVKKK